MELTSKERFDRILKHQPVDRVGLFEVYWKETVQEWVAQGHFAWPEMVSDHFGLDVRRTGGEITPGDYRIINLVADIATGDQVVEETELHQAHTGRQRRAFALEQTCLRRARTRGFHSERPPGLGGAYPPCFA